MMTVERIDGQKDVYEPAPDSWEVEDGVLYLSNGDGDTEETVAVYAPGQWVRFFQDVS